MRIEEENGDLFHRHGAAIIEPYLVNRISLAVPHVFRVPPNRRLLLFDLHIPGVLQFRVERPHQEFIDAEMQACEDQSYSYQRTDIIGGIDAGGFHCYQLTIALEKTQGNDDRQNRGHGYALGENQRYLTEEIGIDFHPWELPVQHWLDFFKKVHHEVNPDERHQ